MRSLLAAALAGLLAAAGAGCGGTGHANRRSTPPPGTPPPALSPAQFVRAADRICVRAHRREKALKSPTNPGMLAREVRVAISVLERETIALRGLRPPRRDTALFRQVLATLDADDIAAHRWLDSIEARRVARMRALARRMDGLERRVRSLERKLGLIACARPPA